MGHGPLETPGGFFIALIKQSAAVNPRLAAGGLPSLLASAGHSAKLAQRSPGVVGWGEDADRPTPAEAGYGLRRQDPRRV